MYLKTLRNLKKKKLKNQPFGKLNSNIIKRKKKKQIFLVNLNELLRNSNKFLVIRISFFFFYF